MIFPLPQIYHNFDGFDALASLYEQTKEDIFDDIVIDMQTTKWFDADMCAAFGAILYSLGDRLNEISLIHIPQGVERILSKNGFLSHYGRVRIPDQYETTIAYQRFNVEDARYFFDYIEDKFVHRSEIPEMSPELSKKFCQSIFEIFINAVLHSHTKLGIFSCGQFFPKRNRLDFTVADLGIGICQNIKDYTGFEFSPEDAIIWATKEFNSTKNDKLPGVPGGLGLKILCDFIDLNGGCIRIVSDAGYWRRRDCKIVTRPLNYPFPGTVVSVEINTADTSVYKLASELNPEDIF